MAQKLLSSISRRGQPKSFTDIRDLKVLLLTYPQLRTETGSVPDRLRAAGADDQAIAEWNRLVAIKIESPSDADEFGNDGRGGV